MTMTWTGVMPAITTPFTADGDVDHAFLARHALWMIAAGCTGIVALGSLGEAATLSVAEKRDVLRTLAKALDGRVPLVAGIAALSTDEACGLAREAAEIGCAGLMVLPPYVYSTDWREMYCLSIRPWMRLYSRLAVEICTCSRATWARA